VYNEKPGEDVTPVVGVVVCAGKQLTVKPSDDAPFTAIANANNAINLIKKNKSK
jgi:hypothetical protein